MSYNEKKNEKTVWHGIVQLETNMVHKCVHKHSPCVRNTCACGDRWVWVQQLSWHYYEQSAWMADSQWGGGVRAFIPHPTTSFHTQQTINLLCFLPDSVNPRSEILNKSVVVVQQPSLTTSLHQTHTFALKIATKRKETADIWRGPGGSLTLLERSYKYEAREPPDSTSEEETKPTARIVKSTFRGKVDVGETVRKKEACLSHRKTPDTDRKKGECGAERRKHRVWRIPTL